MRHIPPCRRKKFPAWSTRAVNSAISPVATGLRYFFKRGLREQLRAEIHAQFEKFRATGLPLDHVNGHLHLHLHPTVFSILMEDAATSSASGTCG